MKKFFEIFEPRKSLPRKTTAAWCASCATSSLTLREGEFVALIGHSGCGKIDRAVDGRRPHHIDGGGVVLAGREIEGAGPDRGMVFQSPCLLPWLTRCRKRDARRRARLAQALAPAQKRSSRRTT